MTSIRALQPGETRFKAIFPQDIAWRPFDAFPAAVRLAILVGHPSAPAPYIIRVKVPAGVKLQPHVHPEDCVYTVMSGMFYVGRGPRFDGERVVGFPPGSVIVLPSKTPHFHWAKSGEFITQVAALGPLSGDTLV
jgi:hypothetical protein